MLYYPHINPVAFSLGPIKVHWYGLMYLISFVAAWALMLYRAKKFKLGWSRDQVTDIIFYGALGVILGGRLGYVVFYNLPFYLQHPLNIFKIWDGGMSYHGGMIGVFIAMWLWCRHYKAAYFTVTDFIAPMIPIGLGMGRLGNFINGELIGRVTSVPWGMVYPGAGPLPHHPSELYEFLLEGVLLFIILWFYSSRRPPKMAVSGAFLIFYGLFRIFCEFFRTPDAQLGFIAFGWMTMGQLLCLPMLIVGVILMVIAYRRKSHAKLS
jgi:phosphatidylglycerol---prolipoprotein diacylglyceryl transferase